MNMRRTLIIVIIMLIVIFITPIFSNAADFYVNSKSTKGIYEALLQYRGEWLNADPGNISGDWGMEGAGQVENKWSVCYGHRRTANGNSSYNRLRFVIDIGKDARVVSDASNGNFYNITDKNERYRYYQLAYFVKKATETNEEGLQDLRI